MWGWSRTVFNIFRFVLGSIMSIYIWQESICQSLGEVIIF